MITKCVGLALIASLSLLGVAHAQTPGAASTESPIRGSSSAVSGSSSSTTPGAAVAVGWYFVHVSHCWVSFDGVYNWLVVYPVEGGYWYTTFLPDQIVLTPACQAGNVTGFYVDNANGHWSSIWTTNSK